MIKRINHKSDKIYQYFLTTEVTEKHGVFFLCVALCSLWCNYFTPLQLSSSPPHLNHTTYTLAYLSLAPSGLCWQSCPCALPQGFYLPDVLFGQLLTDWLE